MADFPIESTRGGQNDYDPPVRLQDDQCPEVRNIEWTSSALGERRLGADAIDLVGSPVENCDRIVFSYRHLPTTDEEDAQLWLLGITDGTPDTAILCYKDTTWHTVTMDDALTIDGVSEYQIRAASHDGKMFLAYNSAVDRLHVAVDDDGTFILRRAGLAEAGTAPVVTDTAAVGTFSGDRYYRTRFTEQDGSGGTIRRGEPTEATVFTPAGNKTGAIIPRPSLLNEGETHWEVEASVNGGDFYVIATATIATATVTDTTAYTPGYDEDFELAPELGEYTTIPSVRHLAIDRDRVIGLGGYEDEALHSARILWTPVGGDPTGDGNDERIDENTDPIVYADKQVGGRLTGVGAANGTIFAFKRQAIYKLSSTTQVNRAYALLRLTDTRGAIYGSVLESSDGPGNATVSFLDPNTGAGRIGVDGLRFAGRDIRNTWARFNKDAVLPAVCLYYPDKKQNHWWIAVDDSDTPNLRLVQHTDYTTVAMGEVRKGWAVWDGPSASVLCACLYADNIDADTDRSLVLRPFIGREANADTTLVWKLDTTDEDNGVEYDAYQITKPLLRRNGVHQFAVEGGLLIAKAAAGASVIVTLIGQTDRNEEQIEEFSTGELSLTPIGAEESVHRRLSSHDIGMADLNAVQVKFEDPATPGTRWELELLVLTDTTNQTGGGGGR